MDIWLPAITVVGIYTLAVMSPGPNFLVITRNALAYSRRTGLQTALGVASGSIVWIIFGFFGVAVIFSQLPLLFMVVKIFGTAYLTFMALKLLWAQFGRRYATDSKITPKDHVLLANGRAFKQGLLTQMSNPKAALFVLALFSSIVSPETPTGFKLILTLVMTAVSFSWYLLVAAVFSHPGFQSVYGRFQLPANLCFAGLLLYLAVNILVSS